MAHAESRRARLKQPPQLGRIGTGARLLHAGRSSCGRCSIRRRPAPGRPALGRTSWGRKPAPAARSTQPLRRGVCRSRDAPYSCSNVPPCSRDVPALWNTVSRASLLVELPLSSSLFQINRNRYRERGGGQTAAALLVLWVYADGTWNTARFNPQPSAPERFAMFQTLWNNPWNTARPRLSRGRVRSPLEPTRESPPPTGSLWGF